MDEALKSPLLKSHQPAKTNGEDGAGEEGNYNYVSWELVNQPSAGGCGLWVWCFSGLHVFVL